MAQNIQINLVVDDKGTLKEVSQRAKVAKKELEGTATSAHSADRRLKGAAQASSNTSKNFSKMAQGITGGLVPAYAVLAANVFAISAAFNFFREAADFKILQESQIAFAASTGNNLSAITNQLQRASGGMLRFQQAAQAAAIGAAKGFSASDLESLTEGARKASAALGRSFEDTFDRLIRGVSKAEPELLDELGITLRLAEATETFANKVGKATDDLTTFERSMAVLEETQRQLDENFGAINLEGLENPFIKLQKTFDDIIKAATQTFLPIFEAIANIINRSATAAIVVFGAIGISIAKAALPVDAFGDAMTAIEEDTTKAMTKADEKLQMVENRIQSLKNKADELVIDAAVKVEDESRQMIERGSESKILKKAADDPFSITKKDRATLARSLKAAEKQYKEHGEIRTGIFAGENIKMVRGFAKSLDDMQKDSLTTSQKIGTNLQKGLAVGRKAFTNLRKGGNAAMRGLAKGAQFMGRAFSKVLGVAGIIGGVIVAIQALEQMRAKSFDIVMSILKMVDKTIDMVGQSAFGRLFGDLVAGLIRGMTFLFENVVGKILTKLFEGIEFLGLILNNLGFKDLGAEATSFGVLGQKAVKGIADGAKAAADSFANMGEEESNLAGRFAESGAGKMLKEDQDATQAKQKLTDALKAEMEALDKLNEGLDATAKHMEEVAKDTSIVVTEFDEFMRRQRTMSTSGFGSILETFTQEGAEVSDEALKKINETFVKLGQLGGPKFAEIVARFGTVTTENLGAVQAAIVATEEAASDNVGTFSGLEQGMKNLTETLFKGGFAQGNFTAIERMQKNVKQITTDTKALEEAAAGEGLKAENFFLEKFGMSAEKFNAQIQQVLDNFKQIEAVNKAIATRGSLGMLLSGGSKQDNQNQIKVLNAQKAFLTARARIQQLEFQRDAEGVSLTEQQAEELRVLTEQLPQLETALDRTQKSIKDTTKIGLQLGKGLEDGFTTAFQAIIQGTQKAKDAFGQMAKAILADIAAMITRMFVLRTLQAALGGTSTGNFLGISQPPGTQTASDGGFVPPLFRNNSGRYGLLPKMALGGIARGPQAGYPAVLHGTEAVIPMPNGKSIPVEFAGGSSTANNVNVSVVMSGGGDNAQTTSDEEGGRRIGSVIAAAVQEELHKQRRPGGILSPYGGAG